MNALTSIQVECIKTALAKLFAQKHFSICVIDDILQVTRGIPDRRHYDTLRLLHCVDYAEMTPRLRIELPRLVQLVIESQPMPFPTFAPPPTSETLELTEKSS